ncbi:hypothetical protein INR49_025780 [Caranx melampygus]|nr:hypothetical protein INR49_025780 [Caranx melampygus]
MAIPSYTLRSCGLMFTVGKGGGEGMRLQVILCLLLQLTFEFSSCSHLRVISGSRLELPCPSPQPDSAGSTITWIFNGKDISEEPSGSVSVKRDGLYLSIFPVSPANNGEYICVVKESNTETIRTYSIVVVDSLELTVKVNQGSDVHLPCSLPSSSEITANALWYKKTDTGIGRMPVTLEDDTADAQRINLLYPLDQDQTILIKEAVTEDSGTYYCETPDGKRLSTIQIIVEVIPTKPPFSCDAFPREWEPCQDENSRTDAPMLQESMTEFSMKLYLYLRESYPSSNLLISPISISGALSHLLLGARDKTRKAIERAVCVPHDFHCVHFQMKKLRERLVGSLQMASQIYYDPNMNLTESFTNESVQFYEAEPTRLLNNSEDNTRMINSWVANKTQNKITKLVDSVSPGTQMILLNAVSFNGEWKINFDLKPKKGLFTKLDGDMVMVPLLYHRKYMTAMTYVVELKAQVTNKYANT